MSEYLSGFRPNEFSTEQRENHPKENFTIEQQARDYFKTYFDRVIINEETARIAHPDVMDLEFAINSRAESIALEAINRNNEMADIITSNGFVELLNEQRSLRGDCAVGIEVCIDGRIATAHTAGPAANVHEAMAGSADTSISTLTGDVILKSQTVVQAIEQRPKQEAWQLVQLAFAHGVVSQNPDGSYEVESNCGAMAAEAEAAMEQDLPFNHDDLIAQNFEKLIPSLEAITRTYNAAATAAGKPELQKVGVRAVYDTKSQGILIGYGEENPLFSTALTKAYEEELQEQLPRIFRDTKLSRPGYYRETYTEIGRYFEKERHTTQIISYLMEHKGFQREMQQSAGRLTELKGLTPDQLKAIQFKMARGMAFQYLTGLHKQELPSEHKEQYQAITIDDGYGVTVGKNDPEVQVFAANTATIPEAVNHVLTQVKLMDHYSPKKPYVLFISSGIAEGNGVENNPEVRKQARANVGRMFNGITQNKEIANLIAAGILVPVPAIVTSRNGYVIEIPPLLR